MMKATLRFVSVLRGTTRNVFRVALTAPPAGPVMPCVCVLLMFGLPASNSTTRAQTPSVQFDVNSMVGCRDVTPSEFEQSNPDEKLMEAKFQVSSLIREGHEDGLIQYLYRFESPERSLRIADYLPKTTLATNVIGNVGMETKVEKSSSLGFTAAGNYDQVVQGDATAARSSKTTSSVRCELLPRLELLAAAGTTSRNTGVYFKLKPSDRISLEGAKEFALVLRVPRTWRGDYVRVVCEAKSHKRSVVLPFDTAVTCGSAGFVVALYDARDPSAKTAARQFVRAEQQLLDLASTHRKEIERRKYPTVGHEIAATLALVNPKIPRTWLRDVYQRRTSAGSGRYERHLPDQVRQAASQYRTAKRTLHQLSGFAITSGLADRTSS